MIAAAAKVRGILAASHSGADDSLIVPADLLAEQQAPSASSTSSW